MTNCKLRVELADYLKDCINYGIDDDGRFSEAVLKAAAIIEDVSEYVEKNGEISLACASDWLYQNDRGQETAIELVGEILDDLSEYTSYYDDEEDGFIRHPLLYIRKLF